MRLTFCLVKNQLLAHWFISQLLGVGAQMLLAQAVSRASLEAFA
jgi:hypothetical protein